MKRSTKMYVLKREKALFDTLIVVSDNMLLVWSSLYVSPNHTCVKLQHRGFEPRNHVHEERDTTDEIIKDITEITKKVSLRLDYTASVISFKYRFEAIVCAEAYYSQRGDL